MTYKLLAKGGAEVEIPAVIAKHSVLLSQMIEDEGDEEIPLNEVQEECLKKVVAFMQMLEETAFPDIKKPLISTDFDEVVSEPVYVDFIKNLQPDEVFEVGLAANYMDIKPLLDLISAYIATQIKGKPANDIREFFGMQNDFTEAEEAKVAAECKMAEENF